MIITKERVTGFLDVITEWCFYVLIFAVTFSNSIVEIASTVMIVAWALALILRKEARKLKFPASYMLAAYFVWVLLSCFNSAHLSESFRGIFKALQYALVFMAASTLPWSASRVKKFLYVAAAAVVMVCVNGLFQYVTGTDLIRNRGLIPMDHLRRISSSFIHPNDFGAYLMVMASVFVSLLISGSKNLKKVFIFAAVFVLTLGCLFLTGSRGAWMSFAAAFVVVGILKGKKMALAFICILAALFFLMPSAIRGRIYETADFESGTTWERVMIWKGSVNMIKERPVLGFGVNTFSKHFPDYKPEGYPDDRYAHNCYLQMASEIGVPGALFFLGFIFLALFSSLKGILPMSGGERKSMAVGLFGGSVGFVLNSAVDTHLFSVTLAFFFSLLLGSTFSVSRYSRDDV
jgi:O-antigen ligase